MLRSFLPVGQGAFYLEQFKLYNEERINVVYDCGSLTSKQILKKEIKSNLYENETILFVFISHLDVDHVNGLEFLLHYCNVKYLVLPLTSKNDRYLLSLKYLCDSNENDMDDFLYRFISNPYETLRRESDNTRIITVRNYDDNESEVLEERYNNRTVQSGINILETDYIAENYLSHYWEYVPFNLRFRDRANQLIDALNRCLPEDTRIEDIIDLWGHKSIRTAVKKAYSEVDGSLNTNSMTLFSGIQKPDINQTFILPFNQFRCPIKDYYFDRCIFEVIKPNGCLYTGDYNAKSNWEELYEAYKTYWNYIGCVQVPHHGSYRNYNSRFSSLNSFFVISAGKNNKYRLPSGLVIKDLISERKYPFIVTEDKNKEVIMMIH